MSESTTYSENEEVVGENLPKSGKKLAKYHHAAYTYVVIGIAYLVVFFTTMPPHDFSGIVEDFFLDYLPFIATLLKGIDYNLVVDTISVVAGTLFLGLSYFIYHGYRKLTIVLTGIYAIRFAVVSYAFLTEDIFVAVKFVLPLVAITFYMLARAAWNLKP